MSYAEMVLATVPAAPPTWKSQRATSCPPPISAIVPYFARSRLSARAFSSVDMGVSVMRLAGPVTLNARARWSASCLTPGAAVHATVDENRLARNVVSHVRRQEHGDLRDVRRLADAPIRNQAQETAVGGRRLPRLAVDRCADRPRGR